MANQLCFSAHSTTVSRRDYDRLNIEALLEPLFAVSGFIDASFDGLVESRSTDSDQNDFIERAIHLGSVILEAGKRSARKRSTVHNASVWPLPPELTVKVFSMVDGQSVVSAAATCSLFRKCAVDPLCYTNIDMEPLVPRLLVIEDRAPKINASVSTMIERAGNALQSIKLGGLQPMSSRYYEEWDDGKSFLSSLSANGGAPGSRLRILHLYMFDLKNKQETFSEAIAASLSVCPSLVEIKFVDMSRLRILHLYMFDLKNKQETFSEAIAASLSVCPSLVEIKFVDMSRLRILHLYMFDLKNKQETFSEAIAASLSVCPSLVEIKFVDMTVYVSGILKSASRYCRLLEHFIFEYGGGTNDPIDASLCKEFVLNCPKITTLVLQGCRVLHSEAFYLVKGFHNLKYVDFSGCYAFTGAFLENLGTEGGANSLEVMILRSSYLLERVEIKKFMEALLAGKFRLLRHLDISESRCLYVNDDFDYRKYDVSFIPIKELLKRRPNFRLVTRSSESYSESDNDTS